LTIRDFDIARCRSVARITVEFTPVRFEDSEQRAATAVAFTGFPLQSLDPITSRGYIAAYTSQVAGLGKTEMLIDRTAWPGDSGSPVYLEDGRVIGMVQKRGTGNAEGIAFVRPTRFIQRLLATRQ
jgi:V8-like Glu-specific endopeptidase